MNNLPPRRSRSANFLPLVSAAFLILALDCVTPAQRIDGLPLHNFGGVWSLRQSSGHVVTVTLRQIGNVITGTATESKRTGRVKGNTWYTKGSTGWQSSFDTLNFEIVWDHGVTGVYISSVWWSDGKVRGFVQQKDKPSNHATWSAGPFPRRR